MCGSISAHSSSVVSLAYRSPSRRYLMRVISVHDILGSPSLLAPRQNHKWLKPLNSIFGQPLRPENEDESAQSPERWGSHWPLAQTDQSGTRRLTVNISLGIASRSA